MLGAGFYLPPTFIIELFLLPLSSTGGFILPIRRPKEKPLILKISGF